MLPIFLRTSINTSDITDIDTKSVGWYWYQFQYFKPSPTLSKNKGPEFVRKEDNQWYSKTWRLDNQIPCDLLTSFQTSWRCGTIPRYISYSIDNNFVKKLLIYTKLFNIEETKHSTNITKFFWKNYFISKFSQEYHQSKFLFWKSN